MGRSKSNLSEVVLECARVREVTGVFHSRVALEDAVDALLLSGFDRADIDTLGSLDELRQRLGDVWPRRSYRTLRMSRAGVSSPARTSPRPSSR
jgi:hypothetical protein